MNAMNDVALLTTVTGATRDTDGYKTAPTESGITIFCKIKTATRSEVYEALRSGLKVQMVAVVNADDYNAGIVTVSDKKIKPSLLTFDGTDYAIVRAYQKDDITMELSLSEVE